MTLHRPITALLLSLVIAFTSLSMALARGQSNQLSVITICNGSIAQKIVVDENGQPVTAKHTCPECSLNLFDLTRLAGALSPPSQASQRAYLSAMSTIGISRFIPVPSARGPPQIV